MNTYCKNCRWQKYMPKYPCSLCIYLDNTNQFNFFVMVEAINLFGVAELEHCKCCGKKVRLRRDGKYRIISCSCGNSMCAKCNDEEMIRRWNNRLPDKTKIWKVRIND
nr:MAG TPA: desulfoferrodoxin-like protein [Caudoviricetes sp.]